MPPKKLMATALATAALVSPGPALPAQPNPRPCRRRHRRRCLRRATGTRSCAPPQGGGEDLRSPDARQAAGYARTVRETVATTRPPAASTPSPAARPRRRHRIARSPPSRSRRPRRDAAAPSPRGSQLTRPSRPRVGAGQSSSRTSRRVDRGARCAPAGTGRGLRQHPALLDRSGPALGPLVSMVSGSSSSGGRSSSFRRLGYSAPIGALSPTLDGTFFALSDPTRRGILERLGGGPATISELAQPYGLTLNGIKKHVGILERADLVVTEKVGRARECRLGSASLGEATRVDRGLPARLGAPARPLRRYVGGRRVSLDLRFERQIAGPARAGLRRVHQPRRASASSTARTIRAGSSTRAATCASAASGRSRSARRRTSSTATATCSRRSSARTASWSPRPRPASTVELRDRDRVHVRAARRRRR